MPNSITRKLDLTSEFNEVFSPPKSEPRKMRQPAFFRVARILRDEKKFGRNEAKLRSGERSVVVKFLLADRAYEVGEARIYEVNPQSFLTAENRIGAVVFTYFNIDYCEADSSEVVRGGGVGRLIRFC